MTSIDGALLDRLQLELAEHRGKDNPITSSQLSDVLAIDDGEAQPKTREAIRVLADERNVPVVSGSRGYYIPETRSELDDYLERLDGRLAGIQQRKQIVEDAWDSRYSTDGGEQA